MAAFPIVRIRAEESVKVEHIANAMGEKPQDTVHRLLRIGITHCADELRNIADGVERVAVTA